MPERLCYSPQAQLDLDEIYDYFADDVYRFEWTNADSASVCPGLKILAEKGSAKLHC